MNKRQLAKRVSEVLEENNVSKNVPSIKTVFHITDDQGGKSDFVIKKERMGVKYTIDDMMTVIDALMEVITEAITNGDDISMPGFGCLYLKRRAAHKIPHPVTGEIYNLKEKYVVKFDCGKRLKTAAAVYDAMAEEMNKKAGDIISRDAYDDEPEDVV